MDPPVVRREVSVDPQGPYTGGSLGNSRLTLSSRDTVLASKSTLNLVDASIQVDLTLDIVAYDSDDDIMGRKKLSSERSKKGATPVYSREDIREQYCITSKEVNAIESSHSRRLFGCIPNQDWKACNRGLLLPSCVRKSKIASDENLASNDYDKLQRVRMAPSSGPEGEAVVRRADEMPIESVAKNDREDDDDAAAGFYRRSSTGGVADSRRYTYPESDVTPARNPRARPRSDGSLVGGQPAQPPTTDTSAGTVSVRTPVARPSQLSLRSQDSGVPEPPQNDPHDFPRRTPVTLPNTPDFNAVMFRRQTKTPDMFYEERRQKHVSFDSASLVRSQTAVAGFDDPHLSSLTSPASNRRSISPEKHKSQERLLDVGVRRTFDFLDRKLGSLRSLDVMGAATTITPVANQSLIVAKIRKPMKTQATQTEISFAGKVLLPAYLTLSPRAAGYSLECAEIEIDSPPKSRRLAKPPPIDTELSKDVDMRLRLLSVEGSALLDQHQLLDGVRRRTRDEKEILVNFEPHKMMREHSQTLIPKTPDGTMVRHGVKKHTTGKHSDPSSSTHHTKPKSKTKFDIEPLIIPNEVEIRELRNAKNKQTSDKAENALTTHTITKEVASRTESEDSNQSLRKRLVGLRETSSGTPSGESHKSESGSQYYSFTDYSSIETPEPKASKGLKSIIPRAKPADKEIRTDGRSDLATMSEPPPRTVKFRPGMSREPVPSSLQAEDDDMERWSGSEKSATSSSLEMDRTIAYSSDTEFGSVKSEDSHTLIDPLVEEVTGMKIQTSEKYIPTEKTLEAKKPKYQLMAKDSLTSPESESSGSQFAEAKSNKSDGLDKAPEIVVNKSDLSRTDSNKSDMGSETSEDYMTATEYSDNLETLIKNSLRASKPESTALTIDDGRPSALDVSHLSLPRRKERLHVAVSEITDADIGIKEIGIIPEGLRESVSSVATSPSIESSTSGSYTIDSGLSELELSRKLSSSTIGNSDNEQDLNLLRMRASNGLQDSKRPSQHLEPGSEEDTSVRSRVAKFESLQKDELPKSSNGQKEKHRVTLEIKLETDLLAKAEEKPARRNRRNRDRDEPLSESSIFQKKSSHHRNGEKPEIPPKPIMKEKPVMRRSLSPDAELFFSSDSRCWDSPRMQRNEWRGPTPKSDTESTQSDETLIEVTRDGLEELKDRSVENVDEVFPTTEGRGSDNHTREESVPSITKREIRRSQSDSPDLIAGGGVWRATAKDRDILTAGVTEDTSWSEWSTGASSPEHRARSRGERSHSFSRNGTRDQSADSRPRKHDRQALEFRRTISDTSDLLRIEKRRLLSRTPELEFDLAEMAKVLCTHCGERLRQSLEAEHGAEGLTDRYLTPETPRSQERDAPSRTSVSSRRSSRDHDVSPATTESVDLSSRDRLLLSSGPSSLESLLRRSPRDTPVFYDSPAASDSQGSLRIDGSRHASTHDILHDEDEPDAGVYAESYHSSVWIYIGESEELMVWSRPQKAPGGNMTHEELSAGILMRTESSESTMSEKEFRRRYQAVMHRMVHRKSSLEMYRRVSNKTFDCDKVVTVQRKSGEFGFRIHGSRPVVVSAIEPGTPAEESGLEVGDIIITVNSSNVVEASHSEVVKIAHTGSDVLHLEVARTCHVLAPILDQSEIRAPVYAGFLHRLGGIVPRKWYRRWFMLKQDNCLYYFKNDQARDPLGAIALANHTVTRGTDLGRPFAFKVAKSSGLATHCFAADDEDTMNCWIALLSRAATTAAASDMWMELTSDHLRLPPLSIPSPDCHGPLSVLSGRCWKTWRRRYCVLKDGCVYFYSDLHATTAIGVVHFHGYRLQTSLAEGKKFAFEAIPPEPKFRHYCFQADSESEKKRWLAAMEYSIDRWIKIG